MFIRTQVKTVDNKIMDFIISVKVIKSVFKNSNNDQQTIINIIPSESMQTNKGDIETVTSIEQFEVIAHKIQNIYNDKQWGVDIWKKH